MRQRSLLSQEEIMELFERRLSLDAFEVELGCHVVRRGQLVTADYRPDERDRFFPRVDIEGRVTGGWFG